MTRDDLIGHPKWAVMVQKIIGIETSGDSRWFNMERDAEPMELGKPIVFQGDVLQSEATKVMQCTFLLCWFMLSKIVGANCMGVVWYSNMAIGHLSANGCLNEKASIIASILCKLWFSSKRCLIIKGYPSSFKHTKYWRSGCSNQSFKFTLVVSTLMYIPISDSVVNKPYSHIVYV